MIDHPQLIVPVELIQMGKPVSQRHHSLLITPSVGPDCSRNLAGTQDKGGAETVAIESLWSVNVRFGAVSEESEMFQVVLDSACEI